MLNRAAGLAGANRGRFVDCMVVEAGSGHEGPRCAIRELTEERLITLDP